QRADLLAGRMYFTATTAAFPEGELRGQLLLVPEPSAMALIGIGCFALLLWKAHITHNRVGPRT
ncbi:MAG: CHRD domain-containing protein, partial [Verrucomicrobiota bacterium]|nr:CHRD domain-containing protein [Verrucomicrobiota bacterium]